MEAKKREEVPFVNQRLLNVVHWTLDNLLKVDDSEIRATIKRYMRSTPAGHAEKAPNLELRKRKLQYENILRVAAGAKMAKPMKMKRTRKYMKLEVRHLIAQKANLREHGGKYGQGLYGEAMKKAAGRLYYRATGAIGYFRVVYRPIVQRLNPVCKFKVPYQLTKSLAAWPKTQGYGNTAPATPGNARALLNVGVNVTDSRGLGRRVFLWAIEKAFAKETREMKTQLEKTLQKAADKVNARK